MRHQGLVAKPLSGTRERQSRPSRRQKLFEENRRRLEMKRAQHVEEILDLSMLLDEFADEFNISDTEFGIIEQLLHPQNRGGYI